MDPLEWFDFGLATSRIGVAFRGMDLVAAVANDAAPGSALASRARAQAETLRAHNGRTVQGVLFVESILIRNGLERPPRPQTLQEYARWAGTASKAAGASLAPESPAAAALLLGGFGGDVMTSLTLALMMLRLLDASPGHAWLENQVVELVAKTAEAAGRLQATTRHPALVAQARPIGEQIVALARRGIPNDYNGALLAFVAYGLRAGHALEVRRERDACEDDTVRVVFTGDPRAAEAFDEAFHRDLARAPRGGIPPRR